MKRLKLIKDCFINKDYGQGKAKAKASHDHKAGKRNYNSNNWKDLCTLEGLTVVE